ncbi:hypothetical protein [Dokdonella ginsengisoli]|uniref:Uncharacterized protein n=1 Tax=Dokdonella ginsengisoli TaxID=363846 RepID=A0ABV9QYC9_9GAMM
MLVRRFVFQCVLAFVVLFVQNAQAFFDPPWITPENPLAGEAVSVSMRGGICDWIAGRYGYPKITHNGNEIRILEYGHHYEPGSELCVDGIGITTRELGAFPSGDYTLTVDLIYPHPVFGPTILNIGIVPFSVSAPPAPVSVPVFNQAGTIAL